MSDLYDNLLKLLNAITEDDDNINDNINGNIDNHKFKFSCDCFKVSTSSLA
jgi:hypothetical protein